uniref:Uncharacterized protein n=2 Tax=Pseudo-nitzschia australis TaxID=44445 RepID=A0A7S4EPV0_9STRA
MREVKKKFQKSGGDRTFWLKIRVRVGMTIVLLALFILFVPIGLQANRILSNSFGGKAIPKSFSLEEAIRFIGNYSSAANNQRTPMREFPDQQSFPTPNQKKRTKESTATNLDCQKWIVLAPSVSSTKVKRPSLPIQRAYDAPGWCTVIVSTNRATSNHFMRLNGHSDPKKPETVHFVSMEEGWQEFVPTRNSRDYTNPISRKNMGYLFALRHGAKLVMDLDVDHYLLPIDSTTGQVLPPIENEENIENARFVLTAPRVFNYHSLMNFTIEGTATWPRGFPLQYIHDKATAGQIAYEKSQLQLGTNSSSIGVVQLCPRDLPDVDAILQHVYPIVATTNVSNSNSATAGSRGSLVVPSHAFVPYNARSCIHTYKALWALFLPSTVPQSLSDVYRGYFSQALFQDLDLSVVVSPSDIIIHDNGNDNHGQSRSEHHQYAASNVDQRVKKEDIHNTIAVKNMIDFLSHWKSTAPSLPERILELWVDLYRHNYIEIDDVHSVQHWIKHLIELKYNFPPLMIRHRNDDTVLMGQFNFANDIRDVLFWYQEWKTMFHRIVVRGPFSEGQLTELRWHGIDAKIGKDDKGYHSPIENLMHTLQQYKSVEGVKGVLSVHDDALINVTNIQPMLGSETNIIVFHNENLMDPRSAAVDNHQREILIKTSFYIHPNGTYSKIDGFQATKIRGLIRSLQSWRWWGRAVRGQTRASKDPRSQKYCEADGSYFSPPFAQSDILYVPISLADDFVVPAQIMTDNSVFLEVAMPKIVDMLRQTTNGTTTVSIANLCTKWDKQRGKVGSLIQCGHPVSARHPFKLGTHGYEKWSEIFRWMTTSTQPFEL